MRIYCKPELENLPVPGGPTTGPATLGLLCKGTGISSRKAIKHRQRVDLQKGSTPKGGPVRTQDDCRRGASPTVASRGQPRGVWPICSSSVNMPGGNSRLYQGLAEPHSDASGSRPFDGKDPHSLGFQLWSWFIDSFRNGSSEYRYGGNFCKELLGVVYRTPSFSSVICK